MSGASGGGAASPAFRLTRSVDKVGRKTEMTLVIARLQFKIRALAGAATDQLDQPAGPADPRDREWGGGQRRDAPARGGGGRLAEIRCLGLAAPAPERDADGPRAFGGELKPPRSGHRQAGDFGHHGAQATVPKPFFKASQDGLVVAAFEIDDAVGFQAGLRERRGKQVRAGDTPEHFAARARGDPGGEERGGGAVDRAVSPAATSCSAPHGSPPPGSRKSTAARPKGNTVVARRCRPSICRTWTRKDFKGGRGPHSVWCPPGAR